MKMKKKKMEEKYEKWKKMDENMKNERKLCFWMMRLRKKANLLDTDFLHDVKFSWADKKKKAKTKNKTKTFYYFFIQIFIIL